MAKLLFQGHASCRITTHSGTVIYIDPFAGEGYDLPADLVLITHDNSIAVQAERIIRLEDGRVVYDGDAHAPEAVVQPNFMMAEPKAGEEGTQA